MKKKPTYQAHEKMGEGDPLRMAGLPMQSKGKGKLGKTKRNKNKRRKPFDPMGYGRWAAPGDPWSDKGWP
jgi:hypothetical protein